jgi:nicotinamidase-related amidase
MASALIVVDVQNAFLSPLKAALPNIVKLIAHFDSQNRLCIFSQHGHTQAELKEPSSNQLVQKYGPEGSIKIGTENWRLISDIEELAKGRTLEGKNSYYAFLNTDLEGRLQKHGIKRLFVCGALTDFCVDTTARSAFNRGYETLVVEDASGSDTKGQHKAGLDTFLKLCGEVITTQQALRRVRAASLSLYLRLRVRDSAVEGIWCGALAGLKLVFSGRNCCNDTWTSFHYCCSYFLLDFESRIHCPGGFKSGNCYWPHRSFLSYNTAFRSLTSSQLCP